ncbi:MAG: hypothetical protein E6Q75_04505 [Rheinheimera sp.]|nr:MAG: hypothetical protein E6Q75_04505 [Rheinheimera sp.]
MVNRWPAAVGCTKGCFGSSGHNSIAIPSKTNINSHFHMPQTPEINKNATIIMELQQAVSRETGTRRLVSKSVHRLSDR